MSRHVLLLTAQPGSDHGETGWRKAVEDAGFALLTCGTVNQAMYYMKSYPLAGIIVEVADRTEEAREWISQLAQAAPVPAPPLLGVLPASASADDLTRLSEAGLKSVWIETWPTEFLMLPLSQSRLLAELRHFEAAGMEVKRLAEKTRVQLHDLCQPLSALQGRLQILAAKTDKDDPLHERFKSLVGLVMEVTQHTQRLQQLQREHS